MRLLYLSSVVPVELNAGYSLAYRHLARLAGHEVFIITREFDRAAGLELPHPALRIPEPSRNYYRVSGRIGSPAFWMEREAARVRRAALPRAREFAPDLVLTVWASAYALAAADVAEALGVPLAILFHDDIEHMMRPHRGNRAWAAKRLARIYRQAAARICVGPAMVDWLAALYGAAPTEVVYPIPAAAPPGRLAPRARRADEPVRVGFFGDLGGNYGPVHAVVDALGDTGGELHVFSHSTGAERAALARRAGVVDHGAAKPRELQAFFRASLDATLIPQGFEADTLTLRRSCFPSKIPEACQIGLPLLVVGPPDGSAVRWARASLGPEAVVDGLDRARIGAALRALGDAAVRERESARVAASAAGEFAPARLQERLEAALARAAAGGARS